MKPVLVTWGTKLGGTEGIARTIGEALRSEGFDVAIEPASRVRDVKQFGAAIIGGALYANRWHRDARRLVERNVAALQKIPTWLFSSGPLDDSADRKEIPPAPKVQVLMERVGALGHTTFGGRLPKDAKGFPASAMAKKNAGDWRNPERIRSWATELARALPEARPRAATEPKGRSLPRWLAYGLVGWAFCAVVMALLQRVTSLGVALGVHAVLAPLAFVALAIRYFRRHGARNPLPTAVLWTVMAMVLDAGVVAALVLRDFAMFRSIAGAWLPFALIFFVTWVTGAMMSTMPWPKPPRAERPGAPSPGRHRARPA